MKKRQVALSLMTLWISTFSMTLQAQQSNAAKLDEKYDIMKRDQIDETDIYAIPYDDSEVEDEEEINRDEKRDVFPLPHSK